jgi:hypothetical protein
LVSFIHSNCRALVNILTWWHILHIYTCRPETFGEKNKTKSVRDHRKDTSVISDPLSIRGKPEGKRLLGWKINIKMYLQEMGGKVWFGYVSGQGHVESTLEYHNEPLGRASTTAHNFMNYLKLKLISSELLFIF